MVPRSFRFQVVRMETCLTILHRVHRYLLKSAIFVCLMGHTAVQTSVAQSRDRLVLTPMEPDGLCDDVSHTVDDGRAVPYYILRLDLVYFSFGEYVSAGQVC